MVLGALVYERFTTSLKAAALGFGDVMNLMVLW